MLWGLFQAACREYKKPGKMYEETITSSWPLKESRAGHSGQKNVWKKWKAYNKSHQPVVKTKLHEPVEEFGDEISSACRLRSMLVRLRYKQNFSR